MADDTPTFKPYADESKVVRISELEVGNRVDRVSINGDLVLTKDQAGLALARDLQAMVNRIVQALEAEKDLPEQVQVIAAKTVKNPFA